MPAGSKPGEYRGGRKKGTPNKATWRVEEILQRRGVNPHDAMCDIVLGNVQCNVCRGALETTVILTAGSHTKECKRNMKQTQNDSCICDGVAMRRCESCSGTGYEKISPELRGKMAAELAQYVAPKRKAVEVTGADGGPVDHRMEVVFVAAKK